MACFPFGEAATTDFNGRFWEFIQLLRLRFGITPSLNRKCKISFEPPSRVSESHAPSADRGALPRPFKTNSPET